MAETDGQEERAVTHIKLLVELLSLAYAIWLIWVMVPEHRRKLMAMRVMEVIRRLAERAASRTGEQAISLEARTGTENYVVPYVLSRMRDAAHDVYERVRYS